MQIFSLVYFLVSVADTSLGVEAATSVPGPSCDVCGEVFKTERELKKHTEGAHKKESYSGKYSNNNLNPYYSSLFSLVTVTQDPVPENRCSVCGKVLASKKNLDLHMQRVHKGPSPSEPPAILPLSPVPSNSSIVAANASTNRCSQCGKVLASQKNLMQHMKRVHKDQVINR